MEVLESRLELAQEYIAKGMDYDQYRAMVDAYTEQGKSTGPEQSEARIEYTKLNQRRMKRWDKTFKISVANLNALAQSTTKLTFLAITESWCGDAAASLPIINKIAEASPNISFKVVLRDESLDLMEAFLTNGTMSIPKLIIINEDAHEVVGEWGPRPSIATQMVQACKAEHGKLTEAFKQDLQLWYNKNKGENILTDILGLLTLE
ncbi:thioredoxin family protein [Flagellimonas zhangzhouensis]|uniref:Thioredoxin n=1 Tax=Flagellimonas zhangzhouensis TaxID=1073328 RepID=A0A1H2VFL1_9FLAO|nr:thioredoxin family protein [Allomuricauda zhangzhouensis]SDQ08486.1 Thioredoxin [Allomuricauda zhangzhouensis]SDW66669.1 Thioredoxin [Allomuricauda zhangzhouensis]